MSFAENASDESGVCSALCTACRMGHVFNSRGLGSPKESGGPLFVRFIPPGKSKHTDVPTAVKARTGSTQSSPQATHPPTGSLNVHLCGIQPRQKKGGAHSSAGGQRAYFLSLALRALKKTEWGSKGLPELLGFQNRIMSVCSRSNNRTARFHPVENGPHPEKILIQVLFILEPSISVRFYSDTVRKNQTSSARLSHSSPPHSFLLAQNVLWSSAQARRLARIDGNSRLRNELNVHACSNASEVKAAPKTRYKQRAQKA